MGREFDELFDEWAPDYDLTVSGHDPEYKEVFEHYNLILKRVSSLCKGLVLEFGTGTANLTKYLVDEQLHVIGVEPSSEMRNLAKRKIPSLEVVDGDFLDFSIPYKKVDTIVSTYAFHHLTDEEKAQAISQFKEVLDDNGQIIFADTMFLTLQNKERIIEEATLLNYHRLAHDLQSEYYPEIPFIHETFKKEGYDVSLEQLNKFVWLLVAKRTERT